MMNKTEIFTKEQQEVLNTLESDVIKAQCFDEIECIFKYWLHGTFDDGVFIEKVNTIIKKTKQYNKSSEDISMDKHKEKQTFKEKLEKELRKTNNVSHFIHDDTSKFKAEDSVIKMIRGNEK